MKMYRIIIIKKELIEFKYLIFFFRLISTLQVEMGLKIVEFNFFNNNNKINKYLFK